MIFLSQKILLLFPLWANLQYHLKRQLSLNIHKPFIQELYPPPCLHSFWMLDSEANSSLFYKTGQYLHAHN